MKPRTDAAAARAFVKQIWPDGLLGDGRFTVWRGTDKKSWHYDKAENAVIKSVMGAPRSDMYFGVGLRRNGTRKRGGLDDVVALPGFPADLDAAKPDNEKNYPPTKEQVAEILLRLPVQPSLVWDSAGGLQALWLFHEPWIITPENRSVAIEACREFGRAVRREFQRAGYEADNGSDLSKVLRLPGTINQKWRRTVRLLPDLNGQNYKDWKTILSALDCDVEAISQSVQSPESPTVSSVGVDDSLSAQTRQVISTIPETVSLLAGDLTNPDPSAGDYRLRMLLEACGVSKAQVAVAIKERLHNSGRSEKARRSDYIDRTVKVEPADNGSYVPFINATVPHRLQMDDAAHVHAQDWGSDERLTATHQALLCELARWCKEGILVRVAIAILAERARLTRQQVRNLLNDLRFAGCIDFDPNYPAAKGNLRPTTLFVVEKHSQHVKHVLPVQADNMSTGLYLSPSQHVNPALPKSSQGGVGS